jgi:CRP/FNR family transcriptional regulator
MESLQRADNVYDFYRHPGRAQVACSRCTLGDLCLPRSLSAEETQRFEQIVHRSRPIHSGEHLFRAGDEFQSIASVRTGCFKSYVIDHEGQEQVLGFHLPGEIIGIDAIHSRKHMANVVALDTSAVCGLAFESISSMSRHMPELQNELFRIMSLRISELESSAGDLSADQRIALFLMSLSERFSRRGYSDSEFILSMSRRDIASYLRLATETVSRVLARFQKAGVLEVDRKQVRIRNLDALGKLAGNDAET